MDAMPIPDYTLITLRRTADAFRGPFVSFRQPAAVRMLRLLHQSAGPPLCKTEPERVADEMEGLIRQGAKVIRF